MVSGAHIGSGPIDLTPEPGERRLQIGVIGAGIAGLGAAIALGQAGHDVEIFERSCFANEVGAAINCSPNATRVLRQFGFNVKAAKADLFGCGTVMRGDTMEPTYFNTYEKWESTYGANGYFIHRADLHTGLRELAQSSGSRSGVRAAKIRMAAEVVDIDCDEGTIELADGRTIQKELIVIADGIHSRFVHKISENVSPATRTGQSIFRFLIPTEKLRANPVTAAIFPRSEPSGLHVAVLGNRRMVWYPCRNGTFQNCAMIYADERYSRVEEDWHASAAKEDLLTTYNAFHPALVEMCNQAEDIRLWPLLFRRPSPTWTRGRAVLIGDAAHPMLPHQGQGGAQGLEDGAALGVLLSHIPQPASAPESGASTPRSDVSAGSEILASEPSLDAIISERLRLFQDMRKDRTAAMQIFSNAGQDEARKIKRYARPYVKGEVPTNPLEFHEYTFGYDIVQDCEQALSRLRYPGDGSLHSTKEALVGGG